jgi:hypothetical protein
MQFLAIIQKISYIHPTRSTLNSDENMVQLRPIMRV